MTFSIAYCHYHWFVDSLAGIAVGIGSFYLGRWVYNKMLENR
jgi:membrane-associated phospholipid phosphatase